MSLRGAFMLQILGMVLNNSALVIAWLFFFHHFGTVNGWGAEELIGMMGISMFIFGVVFIFSSGLMDLPRHVDRGSLDSMLTKPQPMIPQLASSNLDPTTFGDVLLGGGLIIWYMLSNDLSFAEIGLFGAAIIIALVVFWCFAILLPNLLAFYIFDSERLSRYVGSFFLDVGSYPTGILTGPLRWFLLMILPGLLTATVPLEALHRFGWQEVLIGLFVATFWLSISLRLFRRSIRRYESSNLVGAR